MKPVCSGDGGGSIRCRLAEFFVRYRLYVLFAGAVIYGLTVMQLNFIPADDTALRYAPMANEFAAGNYSNAFHPMYGTIFSVLGGSLCLVTGIDGFRGCQAAAVLLWAVSVFPLYFLFCRIWEKNTAFAGAVLYLLCSHLQRYFMVGLRDNGRTLGMSLIALGLIAVFQRENRFRYYLAIAAGGVVLAGLRADGFLLALTALAAGGVLEIRLCKWRCWRSICAVLLFFILLIPQFYMTWCWTGIAMPSTRHAEVVKKLFSDQEKQQIPGRAAK